MENLSPKENYLTLALLLTLAGVSLFLIGWRFAHDSVWRAVLHLLAGGLLTLGWIEVVHEWFIAKKVRQEFRILADFAAKGIERVCGASEIGTVGAAELATTESLKVIGIGLSWLLKGGNRERLERLLSAGKSVTILIPNPCAPELVERYQRDEPPDFELGLQGLAERARQWAAFAKHHSSLTVRLYHRYPVANVTIFDRLVLVSPVLYKRRAKDSFTAIFRRPSGVAAVYEDHFKQLFEHGCDPLDETSLNTIDARYPAMPTRAV